MDTVKLDDALISSLVPVRPEDGNKGTFGMAMIVAGSRYMTGAAVLSVSSALRSGAGLVRCYTTDEALLPVKINCPCALTAAFADSDTDVIRQASKLMNKVKAVAIGPGIDEDDKRYEVLLEYLILNSPNLVIDAGALNLISRQVTYWKSVFAKRTDKNLAPAILTPHIGEMRKLIGYEAKNLSIEDLNSQCAQFASDIKSIIVLKNNKTIIHSGDGKCYIYCADNSGMAKGGSGDVLTGIIVGLLSQGMNPLEAAISGVYIHSVAGEITADNIGKRAMLPIDIIEYLPETYERLGW